MSVPPPFLLLERYSPTYTHKQTATLTLLSLQNRNTGELAFAKLQPAALLNDPATRTVLHEASFLQALQGYRGIPFLIWSGKTKDEHIVMLVEHLGELLEERVSICGGKLSIKSGCMMGVEMI
jgi:hypothetical protein